MSSAWRLVSHVGTLDTLSRVMTVMPAPCHALARCNAPYNWGAGCGGGVSPHSHRTDTRHVPGGGRESRAEWIHVARHVRLSSVWEYT